MNPLSNLDAKFATLLIELKLAPTAKGWISLICDDVDRESHI
jgi:hypothetical protein